MQERLCVNYYKNYILLTLPDLLASYLFSALLDSVD